MIKYSVLDAFTGVSAFEKLGIVNFLLSHTIQDEVQLKHAVDYAVKDRPSFGGFILSATKDNDPVAVAIVNRTGIKSGNAPKNILVSFAMAKEMSNDNTLIPFFEKLIEFCNGDLSVNLQESDENYALFEKLGFEEKTVEMRLKAATIRQMVG